MQRRLLIVRAAAMTFIGTVGAFVPAVGQNAATWPDRTIRIVLPFPPGGPSDIVMRLAAEKMQLALKQTIVIDNKAGAGGNLGSAEVARALPDGYTWLFGPDSLVTVNPHVYKQLPFKVDELVPVAIGTQFNQTLVCNPALGVRTVAELIAKAKSGSLSYASGGAGVPGHLSMELLQSMAGFQIPTSLTRDRRRQRRTSWATKCRAGCSPARPSCPTCEPESSSRSPSRAADVRRRFPMCPRWPRPASSATRRTSPW